MAVVLLNFLLHRVGGLRQFAHAPCGAFVQRSELIVAVASETARLGHLLAPVVSILGAHTDILDGLLLMIGDHATQPAPIQNCTPTTRLGVAVGKLSSRLKR